MELEGFQVLMKIIHPCQPFPILELLLHPTGLLVLVSDEVHLVDGAVDDLLLSVLLVADRHLWPLEHPGQQVAAGLLLPKKICEGARKKD